MLKKLKLTVNNETYLYSLKSLLIISLLFCMGILNAQDNINEASVKSYSNTLEKIENNLKVRHYNEENIPAAIKQVATIKSESTECVGFKSADLEKLNKDLISLGAPSKTESIEVRQKRDELRNTILKTEKLLASCRVFVLQSEEALNILSSSQQTLLAARLFAQGPNITNLIQVNWNKPSLWLTSIRFFLTNNTGVTFFSANELLILSAIIIIALFSGLFVRKKIIKYINKKIQYDTFSNYFSRAFSRFRKETSIRKRSC